VSGPRTVLILHRGGDLLRGTEATLLSLLRGIDRDALRPVVVSTHPVMHEAARELGVESHLRDDPELMLAQGDRRLPVRKYARSFRELHRLARDRRVDVFMCNGGGPCQLGVPLAAALRKPLVCYFHHPAPRLYHACWLTGLAPSLVFSSEFTARHTRQKIGRVGEVVHPGIDAARRFVPAAPRDLALRRSVGFGDDDVVFAQFGALVPHKGHDTLVEAFAAAAARAPSARLLVIGDGPEAGPLRALVRERGLEPRVVLTGWVDDVVPYLRHVADVGVLASREEGLGLVNIQASACGLPTLASDSTGIRETIVHGTTGFLFPPDDRAALANLIVRLAADPALRATLGRAGRSMVLSRFTEERYCQRLQQILQTA
jgi:glycosyltransferase involved in cell wall biosynthesis